MDQYRALLLEAEQRYKASWAAWVSRWSNGVVRIAFVVLARGVFVARDAVVAGMNLLYMACLVPLDLALCVIYLLAVNIDPREKSPPSSQDPQDGDRVADLNIIRRMFWSGRQMTITDDFRSLALPRTVVLDDCVLDGKQQVSKSWDAGTRTHTLQVIHEDRRTTVQGPERALEDDRIELTDDQKRYLTRLKRGRLNSRRSLRSKVAESKQDFMYFLTRPTDFKALEKYTRYITRRNTDSSMSE